MNAIPLASSHALESLGMIALVAAVAGWLLVTDSRVRSAAGVATLVLAPLALLASVTGDNESSLPHVSVPIALVAAVFGIAAVAVVALLCIRYPRALLPAMLGALAFRIPLAIGGQSVKLLLPLYLLIAGAIVAQAYLAFRGRPETPCGPRLLDVTLAVFLGLYALQSLYSPDISVATQNACFFYAPFALLYGVAKNNRWDARQLRACVAVLVGVAMVLVFAGFVEYQRGEYLLHPGGIKPNDFDPYFRVQSLFFDPNIFGRFVALVMLMIASVLLFTDQPKRVMMSAVALTILWVGLVLSLSQSSFVALLAGLIVLACIRWNRRWVLGASAAVLIVGMVFVLAFPSVSKINLTNKRSAETSTSGRFDLVTGGIKLWGDRPLWGYGSGGFSVAFDRERLNKKTAFGRVVTTKSHTAPLTVAAEQGLVGLASFIALLFAGFSAVYRRARADGRPGAVARIAVAAAFTALFVHSLAYAAFMEDPLTWLMLGAALSLATIPRETVDAQT